MFDTTSKLKCLTATIRYCSYNTGCSKIYINHLNDDNLEFNKIGINFNL